MDQPKRSGSVTGVAVVLLIVAAANIGYGIYLITTGGADDSTALLFTGGVAAVLAIALLVKGKPKSGG
jgi:uncharacterized membrane protein